MTRFNAFARAATVMAIYRLRNLEPRVAAGLLAPYDTPDHRIGIDRFVHDIPMNRKHRTYEVLEKLESNLKRFSSTPIRIVWGMKDWCFRPECLVRFKQIWPHASIRELSDVGHYVMEEAALEVNEEVEILIRILVSLN